MSVPILEGRDLRVVYGRQEVLNVPQAEVREGEVLAIIGPNGAGKSTLLLTLARLLKHESGEILFNGRQVGAESETSYRRRIGLVMQNPLLLDRSVFDNVAVGLQFRGMAKVEIGKRVNDWLARLNIAHLEKRRGGNLSGGEAQRVALARAFALEPELLLLDEPFSALDTATRTSLLNDLRRLLDETGVTTVFITHNFEEARQLANQVAVIEAGKLSGHGEAETILEARPL